MNIHYNLQGVGDTLLVIVQPVDRDKRQVERKGNVARVCNSETGETTGWNLFNASTIFSSLEQGRNVFTNDQFTTLQSVIKDAGFDEEIDAKASFVVGYVSSMEKHPDADKLNVCQVDVGEEQVQIVCGAPNVAQGQRVVVAKVGAVMPSGLLIRDAELRGVPSYGMICSAKELDLENPPKEKGILVLPDAATPGDAFKFTYEG
ncbi:YtpR family tRNA-binding protein [Bacillus fonticola]|uniref:YtpR family tRNA-binding protein n=1 Tax=Bacillus fonticola TaxID=2728853 RepID=UPI001474B76B|nr:DUF4479 family protein [Bacillus fonticola]